jgi:hypothetical protein
MADVTIDGTISAVTARGMRAVAFTTDQIGYRFYVDSTGAFVYSKTSDGGATWGAAVTILSSSTVAYDIWLDEWTPGITGGLIHLWYFSAVEDDVFYRTLNTTGDSLGTQRVVFAGATAVAGRGTFVSGTKSLDGRLYCAYDIDAGAERGFHRSDDGGTTWTANLSTTFIEATLDEAMLLPASGTGDNADCAAVYLDASASSITVKLWDFSAAAQVESASLQTHVPNATDNTGQYGYSASIRHSDGHIILVSASNYDSATFTQVWDISFTNVPGISTTGKTSIVSSVDDHYYPRVFIDQTTDHIYVAYNGKRDGSEVLATGTKTYYTKSTDGGTSWSAGDTAYMEGAAAAVLQVWAPLMGSRFILSWRVGTTLITNTVNSLTFGGGGGNPNDIGQTILTAGGELIAGLTAVPNISATVPASGLVVANISVRHAMTATAVGSGSVAAGLSAILNLSATFLGTGAVLAGLRGVTLMPTAQMSGAGLLLASLTGVRPMGTVTMVGASSLAAALTGVRLLGTVAMLGQGTLIAPLINERLIGIATMTGLGALVANLRGTTNLSATITATSALITAISARIPIVATLMGQGALLADLTTAGPAGDADITATIQGSSGLSAQLSAEARLDALLAGNGALEAQLGALAGLEALLEGSGRVVPTLTQVHALNAILSGFGTLSAEFAEAFIPLVLRLIDRSMDRYNLLDLGGDRYQLQAAHERQRYQIKDASEQLLRLHDLSGHNLLVADSI